jgi:MSHA pilin protein MshA
MKSLTKQKITKQEGFTLIELVVVIVILGILAVTAAPKFIDLQDDARTATFHAVKASIESVKTLVHSKSLIEGNESIDGDATTAPDINVNGEDIIVSFGYPRSNAASLSDWEDHLLDLDTNNDFQLSIISNVLYVTQYTDGNVLTVVPTSCFVQYAEADSAAGADIPVPSVTDC